MSRPRIYLVRHGETDWNLAGRLQGGKDIPLNDLGREQAVTSARVIQEMDRDPGRLFYVSSPLQRTAGTMAILRATLGLRPDDFARDDRFREIRYGRWEGMSWPELRRREPENLAVRDADPWNFVAPDGESFAMLSMRVLPALAELKQDSVVVTHGGVVRVVLHALAGMPAAEAAELPVRQGAVYVVGEGGFELAIP
ncbi:histidine phosphatase family protein [Ancylobacter sp. 6x-1]|uniref:Histidine phosphatase family protein n=1 Tax=Ancylobacter crimeensis TaxID=2579147 RepID=A0ABT0DAY2_9HYPH|nr:histidine phosphatase family protein [Ancylobacter crimeensis]MCK0197107.1 histidine phosphatase family protein [Ancylobacter crimeensis]